MEKNKSGVKIDLHNKVSTKTLAEIIEMNYNAFHNNSTLNTEANKSDIKSVPICIHGSPGVGKSSVVRQAAKDLGIDFIDVRLSQMEPCDIKGLPVPNKETKSMDWFINGSWPRGKDTKGILFLDEITACDKSIAVAAYELILDRRLGTLYSIPDGWTVVAAGNTVTDRAVANAMSSALANRFMHFELEPNVEDWFLWALNHHIHPAVIGFIQWRPSYLFQMNNQNLQRGWPSPRSWENVSKMCHICHNEDVLRKLVYGLVGNAVGVEFMEYLKTSSKFDDILKYMIDENLDIEEKFGKLSKIEMSEKYAITSALLYHLWRGETEDEQKVRVNGFFRILTKLSSEFASMGSLGAINGSDTVSTNDACEIISKSDGWATFIEKHRNHINKKVEINFELD
jgi:hypothetical protein